MPTGTDGTTGQTGQQNQQQQGDQNQQQQNQQQQAQQIESFEAWLGEQPDDVKAAYEQHVTGLKNTVTATRNERDDLKKQLQDLAKRAEKGSEAEKQLQNALSKIEIVERKANFMEDALRPEIGCKNPRTAYALATAEDLFTRQGTPDWAAIKEAAPELFQTKTPKGGAGSGTDGDNNKVDMNTLIRQKAGY